MASLDDDCEKEWSKFTGLSEKFDERTRSLATNVQASTSQIEAQPRVRQTHHQILELQAEVRKLQAGQAPSMGDLQNRGQRDRDTQRAIEMLQAELEKVKETVKANKGAPKPQLHPQPQPPSPRSLREASISALLDSVSVLEPVSPKELLPSLTADVQPESMRLPSELGMSLQVDAVDTNRLICQVEEMEMLLKAQRGALLDAPIGFDVPMGFDARAGEVDLGISNAVANLGLRKDGRDEELQQLLNDVYDKICVCSERLKDQKAASKAAINGLEGFRLPETLLDEADDARRDTWEEIEWLRQALVGMHQHLMSAQERTRALERQCQEYEAHVQNIDQNGDQTFLSTSFQSDLSQGLPTPPMDYVTAARDMLSPATPDVTSLYPDSDEIGAFPATVLTAPPVVRPPQNYQPTQTASSAAIRELSPTVLPMSLRSGNAVAAGMAMRTIPPMQDLDANTSFAYEPYLNVNSAAAWRQPMVAATPPFDGVSIGGAGFLGAASSPRSVLAPASLATGSTAEAYPSGVASVGAPSRPITMMASYASGSASVGVPSRHIPASSSRPPSISPLRQQRPVSIGPSPGHLHQGIAQRLPVAAATSPQVAQVGFGTALFDRIDVNKDGFIDRWELKAAMQAGALQAGAGVLRHVAEKASAPVTPRTPAPMMAWQTGYPSTMQYFAPVHSGPARSASREPTVM
jgi:hypothetical protein